MNFEKELLKIRDEIDDMKMFAKERGIDLSNEVAKLEAKFLEKEQEIYNNLSSWEQVQVSRHPKRPYTLDYIKHMVDDFVELHGDRLFSDDHAIIGGLGKIGGKKVVIIGHQKGRDTDTNIYYNFGMANPEGYRKALRLMKLAERFNLPVVTLIDTPGAYPGIEAEKHGQGEAIARNLLEMAGLKVPIIATVIGEGGSGGALALGVADKVFMLENSVYSVISPEGCAAILFKDASKAAQAAENLKITSKGLMELGIIDGIVKEPLGGAHKGHQETGKNLSEVILSSLEELESLSKEELLEKRYNKFRDMGEFN